MINVIDLVLVGLILFYLLKNAGGVVRTVKNLIVVLLALMVFGVFAEFLLNLSIAKGLHKSLRDSYLVRVSHVLIKWTYPAIEKTAPKVDAFIKEKIISAPTPEASVPVIALPQESLPKLTIPKLPKLE